MTAADAATADHGHRWWRWEYSFLVLAAIWGCSFWWIKVGLRAV